MKALQKVSKFLSNYTSIVVIAIAVVTFLAPILMQWVNFQLFTDPVGNRFTSQSIILGVIMFSMGLTLTTQDFKILAQRPFDICIGAAAQYLIMPFLAFALTKALHLPDAIALGLILVGCCPGGVSSNIMSYLCGGDVAFSVGMTTVSTLLSPLMTPLMVSLLASGATISIKGLPMFVSIIETVIIPIAIGFVINYLFGAKKTFQEIQKIMPGIAVLGLACVVGGVISSQGTKFFTSGVVIFAAVLLHNGLGYLLGYGAGKLTGMSVAKKRTISIEVGMQNAGLATNLATTSAQFANTPESAVICAVSCVWHSISGTLLAGFFAELDKKKAENPLKHHLNQQHIADRSCRD
ncbi:MAG: bile acid:sodium symporter family protein [Lachnospiraceae bacterium]|nr:bile acid:sodium symporter family protein [Lachnospiraceae bacterium]